MKKIILTLSFLLFSHSSMAQNIKNYQFCNHYKFNYFLMKVYDIYFCNDVSKGVTTDELFNRDFTLAIKYNMNFTKEEIAQSSIEEISRYYDLNKKQEEEYYKKLASILVDVKPGYQIAAFYSKEGKLELHHKGKITGTIEDPEFAKIFINIWLHPKAHYHKMRDALLRN